MYRISKRIASFDVDPQKGFTEICPSELPVKDGHLIVDELNDNAKFASIRVLSKDSHPCNGQWNATDEHPPLTDVIDENGDRMFQDVDVYWPKHCVVGTFGNEILNGLPEVSDYDMVVFKGCEINMHPYGACYHDLEDRISTGIIEFLESKGIDIVIVGGLALDFCVKKTIEQLQDAGFMVILNNASTRPVNRENESNILEDFEKEGVIVVNNSNELEKLIKALDVVYSW